MHAQRQADTTSLAMDERLILIATMHLSVTRWTDSVAVDRVNAALASVLFDHAVLFARLSASS